ncbi:MAG: hypothetical protein OHK93_007293 [Ramalina farinacea]|uniref:Transcription factor domain-containing protein n=1 Tax=Ramalina farinacea TaxID=258253 RepID=A0AA43QLX4_9LECA|nr:hypothetical protein [Ramalina farinacea]
MPQVSEDSHSLLGAVGADKDGHLVVKDSFWSVFCKEVCEYLNSSKEKTLAGYRLATERSLEQVDLLDNPEMPAVQALTLYLSVLQGMGEAKSVWVLTGSLARSATSLRSYKNNLKGCTSNAFEEQMQRRLWGQISFLDSRPQGIPISDISFSDVRYAAKAPGNLNDVDLHPEMSDTPADVEGWTDTTIFLIRYYIRKLSIWLQDSAAKHAKLVRPEERKNLIKEMIEVTYLQYVDPRNPLHCFVTASARLFMTKIELLLQAKKQLVKTSHRMPTIIEESPDTEVFASALNIIELTYSLQNETKWKGWWWQLRGHRPPYQAIRVVLTHLCTNPLDPRYERTLSVVQRTLDGVSESAKGDPAHSLVLDLLASTAQRRKACTTHDANVHIDKSPSRFGGDDLTSETALNNLKSSAPRKNVDWGVQTGAPDPSSTSLEQEPVSCNTAVTPAGFASDETLGLEMDWEELAREMEPCLGAWNAYA